MSVTEELIRKILDLPESRQRDVLCFIDNQAQTLEPTSSRPNRLYGMCADLHSDLPFEEFQKNRREMWGGAT